MKAVVMTERGGPEVLVVTELPDPVPGAGEVLIRNKAFGLNHAELYMRSGIWGETAPVTGIECVGVIEADPAGLLTPGTTVVTLMGGLGRTRNGSYAELVVAPTTNVVPVQTSLSWTDLAALPEVYAATWSGLHTILGLQAGQTVLVRGATSAMGQAAVNIAVADGATVIATTRNPARESMLLGLGADQVLIDDGKLAGQVEAAGIRVDGVLDLVGNSVLRDSLLTARPGGGVAQLGFLGGQDPVQAFSPLFDLPSGVRLSFFGSFLLGTAEFPLSDVPMADLITRAETGIFRARPSRVFGFDEIVEAHRVMEANQALGKLVVSVS